MTAPKVLDVSGVCRGPSRGPVFGLWYGGASYSAPSIPEDVERFPCMAAAVAVFNQRTDNPRYPCCERIPPDMGGPEMQIFYSDPRTGGEPAAGYPDRLLYYGPRGGLINSPA